MTNMLCVDVNYPLGETSLSSREVQIYLETLLHSFVERDIRNVWVSQENKRLAVDIDEPSPSDYLWRRHQRRDRTCNKGYARTEPVQNVGQTSFNALPDPCASQAERYGLRTASGMAAGLNGVTVHDVAA